MYTESLPRSHNTSALSSIVKNKCNPFTYIVFSCISFTYGYISMYFFYVFAVWNSVYFFYDFVIMFAPIFFYKFL